METKTFPLSGFSVDGEGAGRYGGHVAVFGNVDLGGDLIEPGATLASLPDLVAKGFLAFGHDYHQLPIGMIDEAREDATGLYIAGPFHSHAFAQDARRTAAERLAAGKPMGMSIGYDPQEWSYRKVAGEHGPHGRDEVRVLTRIAVLEGSLVPLPMNPLAGLTDVKAAPVEGKPMAGVHACRLRDPGDFQRDSFRTMSRRHDGKPYNVILGRLTGETTTTEQAYRYAVDDGWTAEAARAHCADHDGARFEPAASGTAEWTAAAVNDLPDSAFAVVLWGGEKDADGKTVPRSLRTLPHHGPSGAVDLPHLRNALARLPQADLPAEAASTARRHLERHAAAEGVGEAGKILHDLEHELVGVLLHAKEGRQLSAASRARIRALLEVLDGLDGARADLTAWLEATEPPPKSAAARLRFDTDRLVARVRRL